MERKKVQGHCICGAVPRGNECGCLTRKGQFHNPELIKMVIFSEWTTRRHSKTRVSALAVQAECDAVTPSWSFPPHNRLKGGRPGGLAWPSPPCLQPRWASRAGGNGGPLRRLQGTTISLRNVSLGDDHITRETHCDPLVRKCILTN